MPTSDSVSNIGSIKFGSLDCSLVSDPSITQTVLKFGAFSANIPALIEEDIMPKFAGHNYWSMTNSGVIPSSIAAWLDHACDLFQADYADAEIAQVSVSHRNRR